MPVGDAMSRGISGKIFNIMLAGDARAKASTAVVLIKNFQNIPWHSWRGQVDSSMQDWKSHSAEILQSSLSQWNGIFTVWKIPAELLVWLYAKEAARALFQYSIRRLIVRKIAQSLKLARFVFGIVQSLWNLRGTLTAMLLMCLSNFKALW